MVLLIAAIIILAVFGVAALISICGNGNEPWR